MGIFVMVGWRAAGWGMGRRFLQQALSVAAICILFTLSLVARHQLLHWHDDFTLFTYVLQNSPQNAVAHDNLGAALGNIGNSDEAAQHFRVALAINPQDPEPHFDPGLYYLHKSKLAHPVPQYGLCLYWSNVH